MLKRLAIGQSYATIRVVVDQEAATVAKYLPFAGQHSIQEAAVSVQFQTALPAHLVELMQGGILETHEEAFPRVREIHGGEVKIDVSDPSSAPSMQETRLTGFELSRPQGDGAPASILRLSRDVLQVSFLEYTKWEDVVRDSVAYVRSAIARVPLAEVPVRAFGLRYVDRFTFNGRLDQACAELLFKPTAAYLARSCFESGPLWHCSLGWFEDRSEEERVLNQLNVLSTTIDDVPSVTIDHDATWQLQTPRQSIDSLLQNGGGKRTPLTDALGDLHDGNKKVIRAVLLDNMLEQIGLAT